MNPLHHHRHHHKPMTQLCRALVRLDGKWSLLGHHLAFLRRFLRFLRDRLLSCSCIGTPQRYRRIKRSLSVSLDVIETASSASTATPGPSPACLNGDSDMVALKVSLLGDCQTGKTSFMVKYVGDVKEQRGLEMSGLNLMDKIFCVRGARIAFNIWDVGGDHQHLHHVPIACKDAAAILFMFDLTNRQTLNNVLGWYRRARKWNKTAVPVMIGTKFDDFAQLPLEMQWTIANQARVYAKAMNATLFFSSATHDINVSKIFKFITAKIFNLPWTVERNLTLGEPIIDF